MDDPSEVPDLLPCLISPKVALAEVAVIGAIFAILKWQPDPPLWAGILIALIILIGIAAVYRLAKDEFNLRRAKHLLALRLEEGQALWDRTRQTGPTKENEPQFRAWDDLTESDLRRHVDESHVARFRFAGFRDEPFSPSRLEKRLLFLNELLEQLKG